MKSCRAKATVFQSLMCKVLASSSKLLIAIFSGSMKLVSGAVVEGLSDLRIPIKDWKFTVSHYSVDFSPDGRLWRAVTDEDGYYRVSEGR